MLTNVCAFIAGLALLSAAPALAQPAAPPTPPPGPTPHAGDFVIRDFRFQSGESVPELRIHYTTFGAPHRDAAGHVDNAVLILHGTGGAGTSLIRPEFSGQLFGPGELLDAARYYLILPDDIGHGGSSKPSDGLRAHFPHYDYADMVEAEHRLVTEGLGVDHLRLVMGTSMGCMHSFMWGEAWPSEVDALMPLACLTVQIAGRNRVWRDMEIQAIKDDPAWMGGDYVHEPVQGLTTAAAITVIAGSAPQQMQKALPTRDAADAYVTRVLAADLARMDANDTLYQVDSSRDYNPSARLGEITAPVMWVNSADDFINPPELGIAEQEVKKIPHGRFVLLPIGPNTHGHGTHTFAVAWKDHLAELLAESGPLSPLLASGYALSLWAASWMIASIWTRRTQARPSAADQAVYFVPTWTGTALLVWGVRSRIAGLSLSAEVTPLWLTAAWVGWLLTGACVIGVLLTWWARLTLGDLWSSSVSRKQDHTIIEAGPYRLVRHPIYTGLILAVTALALQLAAPVSLAGVALIALGFWLKARLEERFLSAQLGEAAYADYRRRTPMLVPYWPMGRPSG